MGLTQDRKVEGILAYNSEIEENTKFIRALFRKFQPSLGDSSIYRITYVPVRADGKYEKGIYVLRIVVHPPLKRHLFYWEDGL